MRYAIISDIHANLEALTVVLDRCNDLGIKDFICLGDIVGYNANPKECLDIIRGLNMLAVVKGNHDEYVSNNDEVMEGFNPQAKASILWTKTKLAEADRAWLAALPMKKVIAGTNITAVHATLDSPDAWGYIFDIHHAADNFSYQFTQLCFCGHSHAPIAFCKKPLAMRTESTIDEITEWGFPPGDVNPDEADAIEMDLLPGYRYLLNVGSVGQPRNRDPRASFAMLDTNAKKVYRFRLPYDYHVTQEKILAAGLPERNATRLATGN